MNTTLPAGWKPRLGCPFCGSNCLFTEPDEIGSGGQWVSPIHVGCNDCKAEQMGDTEDEAVSRWNARSTPPASAKDDPITVSLDPDPRGVSVGVWQGSHCIYNGAHAVPVSAQDDAKDDGITPADAVYGLMAWLSGRDEVVTLSSRHGAAIAAELANAFCNENGLQKFSQGYPDNLKYPTTSLAQQHDAKDERQAFEAWSGRTNQGYDLTRNVSGKMATYESNTTEHAYRGFFHGMNAPAAGDARDALRELVECDNIKKRIASMQVCVLETEDDVQELDTMMSDLARRQPAAWDAARAAIAAQQGKGGT